MSIRLYNKDHLKDHVGITQAASVRIEAPDSNDQLVFWTQHDKYPCEVNLHSFSKGQEKSNHSNGGGRRFNPFTGRPELILQLSPTLKEVLWYATRGTVYGYMNALRDWWRILDDVENAAAAVGQPMTRIEDVRLLTQVHSEYAHRNGMTRQAFGKFRALVDTTRMALGGHQTYWESPEDPDEQKHIPPQEQRDALRFAIRGNCRSVLKRWAQSDALSQSDTEPDCPDEAKLWRNVKFMRDIQKKTGKLLPTPDDLCEDIPPWALNSAGTFRLSLRNSVFPNHRDADAVWHLCVLNTGWNPSTITTLDVSKKFLFDHFKDDINDPHKRYVLSPQTYELVGEKERAGGKEQFVTGQWKSLDGPGHLIKTYLERVEPLRGELKQQLALEQLKYKKIDDANYNARKTQFALIKTLEQGVRSVWLYVSRRGDIAWISNLTKASGYSNGKQVFFLTEITQILNSQRAAVNARRAENKEALLAPLPIIPLVAAKNFRVWFADYVYRSSNRNMLQVKRVLNHSRLGTTGRYLNTNILNQESSDAARRFLNILVADLDASRVDLTVLAHLYRYGEITPEQEILLAQARVLPRSRMNVACKDSRHPPQHIKATEGESCDVQRCMLCPKNAVLLPESLDGIAMRVEELRALQGFLPIETWVEEIYDIELKNNLMALRKYDLSQGLTARKKWAKAITTGDHYVPGLPIASIPELLELV